MIAEIKKEVTTMTKKEFDANLVMLQEQDKELARIFAVRESIREKCIKEGGYQLYNKMWEALLADHESHWSF